MRSENPILTILAIDDDPDILAALSAVIEDRFPEASFLTAEDGVSGLTQALTGLPDVIFLDIVLPGLSGYTVCEKLKKDDRTKDIPVVFMTAHQTDRRSRVRALESGGEGFLIKPFEESELLAQIRAMAKIREAHERARSEHVRLEELVADRTQQLVQELEVRSKIEKALRASEERYRLVVENSRELLFTLDPQGCFVFLSASASSLLGYQADQMMGRSFDPLIHPDDLSNVRDLFRKSLHESYQSAGTEFRLLHASGEWRWFVTRGSWVRAEDGRPFTFTGIASDITDRKLAELQAQVSDREAREALRRSNESSDRLLSLARKVQDIREEERRVLALEIHDELGQVLTAVKMDIGLIERTLESWGDRYYTSQIPDRVSALKGLADQAIESTRTLMSRLRPEVLDRLGFGSAIEWFVGQWTTRYGIPCHLDFDNRLQDLRDPLAITLFRVTQEGLTNIAKHARAGRATVRIARGPGGVLLEITDDGIGIDQEAVRKDGFGLLGMRERVETLGGRCEVVKGPDVGTILHVEAPEPVSLHDDVTKHVHLSWSR